MRRAAMTRNTPKLPESGYRIMHKGAAASAGTIRIFLRRLCLPTAHNAIVIIIATRTDFNKIR